MQLTDILPVEKWIDLENDIHTSYGLNPTIYDTQGVSITQTSTWPNKLCPEIKATSKGQTFICSAAHQNIAGEAQETRKPVVDMCDCGLLKVVVPIFSGDTFIGAAGGCGLLMDGEEVETFLVSKTLDVDEEHIEQLSHDIPLISEEKARQAAQFINDRITKILDNYAR